MGRHHILDINDDTLECGQDQQGSQELEAVVIKPGRLGEFATVWAISYSS